MILPPQPGDFAVIDTGTSVTFWVELGEALSGGGFSEFNHAVICSRLNDHGIPMIVEAMPGGAVEVPWHYDGRPHLWSSGRVTTSPAAGAAARKYVGTGYSGADYLAIAAHAWHLPLPGLRSYVAGSKRLICSQLVDQAEADAGVHLFRDGRWPGFCRPSDLAALILSAG